MKCTSLASVLMTLMFVSMLALAQPAQPQDAPDRNQAPLAQEPGERTPPQGRLGLELKLDPEALRIRLQRSIARSQEMIDRSQAALERLEAGASAAEVLRELRVAGPDRQPRSGARSERETAQPGALGDASGYEDVINFMRAELPELWANLAPFIEKDPRSAERLLGRMSPQIREILALQRTEPELAKIKAQQMRAGLNLVEAGRVYRTVISNPDATQSERESALGQIRLEAERRFDVELEGKQHEIDRLEARLAELRESVELIEQEREREIELMVVTIQRNQERLIRQQSHRQRSGGDAGSRDD